MAQFGLQGNIAKQQRWRGRAILDEADSTLASNTRGTLTFAHAGKNSRVSQFFINFGDNSRLDRENFPPLGVVIERGMEVVDALHVTGEGAPSGKGPSQGLITSKGDAYLNQSFPELSRIVSARLRPAPRRDSPTKPVPLLAELVLSEAEAASSHTVLERNRSWT